MSEAIKRRRGTDVEHSTFVGLEGEFTFNTTTKRIHAHDAVTPGGVPAARLDEVGGSSANEITYDGTGSGLAAGDVQAAIDEVAASPGRLLSGGDPIDSGYGAWSYFADPRAVRHSGTHDRTYFTFVEPDFAGNSSIVIACVDHETGLRTRTVLRTRSGFYDDHDVPAILVRADGRIVVFYPTHSGDVLRYKISTNPEDISSFGAEQVVNAGFQPCYPNPVMLSAESNRIYVFYADRTSNREVFYSYSDNQASSFSAPVKLVARDPSFAQGIYLKVGTNSVDRVDLALSGAVGPMDQPKRDIRHLVFAAGSATSASGASLGALPIAWATVPAVYTSASSGNSDVWVADCSTNGGNTQIVYAEFPSVTDHRYRYARWSGSAWVDEPLCRAGSAISVGGSERYYFPGISLNHDRDGEFYASVGNSRKAEIQRWRRSTDSGLWTLMRVTESVDQNVRPVVPRNASNDLAVIWLSGSYHHYLHSRTKVMGAPLDGTANPINENPTSVALTTSGQSYTGGSGFQVVNFDTIIDGIDLNNEFVAASKAVKIRKPGLYSITVAIGFSRSGSTSGQVAAEVRVNGTRIWLVDDQLTTATNAYIPPHTSIERLAAGDVLDVRFVSGTLTGSFDAVATKTFFKVHQIG